MFLKLTKNSDGTSVQINPAHIVSIEEGFKKDNAEMKSPAGPKTTEKNKGKEKAKDEAPATIRIVKVIEHEKFFIVETFDEINAQFSRSGGKTTQKTRHLEIQTRLLAELLQKQGMTIEQIKDVVDLSKPYFQKK